MLVQAGYSVDVSYVDFIVRKEGKEERSKRTRARHWVVRLSEAGVYVIRLRSDIQLLLRCKRSQSGGNRQRERERTHKPLFPQCCNYRNVGGFGAMKNTGFALRRGCGDKKELYKDGLGYSFS